VRRVRLKYLVCRGQEPRASTLLPTGQTATVGNDDNANNVFWNTSFAGFYADGGAAGVGIFRQDTNWAPYGTVAVKITATPPVVGPPNGKDQCKNVGWMSFNNPSFKNQGDCVSFISTGGLNPSNG